MPYKSKKVRNKTCVYKKSDGKRIGCTKGSVKKYLAALHANVKETVTIFDKLYDDVLQENSLSIHDIDNFSNETLDSIIHFESWYIDKNIKPDFIKVPHIQNGYFDQYSIKVNNLQKEIVKFENIILYQDISFILQKIKSNEDNQNLIQKLQLYIDKTLVTFKFMDDKHRLKITGELGYNAKGVMDFVLSSIMDSLNRNKDKTVGFYYTVGKTEIKRIHFYDEVIGQVVKYQTRIVDSTSQSNQINVYYIF